MAINSADAKQFARVLLIAYGEDYALIGTILRPLRAEWPSINWMSELTAVATNWQPFLTSGLSIQWWLNEVDRLSQ